MSEYDDAGPHREVADSTPSASTPHGAWVIDTRDLGRRPGLSRSVRSSLALDYAVGSQDLVEVPSGTPFHLDLLLESVVEGVLVTGDVGVATRGQCARCLDPIADDVHVGVTELFAYPDSATEATTEEDEVSHVDNESVDLEPVVRDAVVLALPLVPLCSVDCQGLCGGCGVKWAELEPEHEHESIDPRWAALLERFEEQTLGDNSAYDGNQADTQ